MLSRWDPFQELISTRNRFERLFNDLFEDVQNGGGSNWATTIWSFPLDLAETEDHYLVMASLPGVNTGDLEITYSNNTLTIKGETAPEQWDDKTRYYLRERRSGRFQRSISFPMHVDADNIEASYEAGVLKLSVPKSEEARPKHIPIQSGSKRKMIEGKFKKSE